MVPSKCSVRADAAGYGAGAGDAATASALADRLLTSRGG
jgi:hypothetical protein